jgi:hypothetical protein
MTAISRDEDWREAVYNPCDLTIDVRGVSLGVKVYT